MQPTLKTRTSIYQSKASLNEKIIFGKSFIVKAQKLDKCLKEVCMGRRIPVSILVPYFLGMLKFFFISIMLQYKVTYYRGANHFST